MANNYDASTVDPTLPSDVIPLPIRDADFYKKQRSKVWIKWEDTCPPFYAPPTPPSSTIAASDVLLSESPAGSQNSQASSHGRIDSEHSSGCQTARAFPTDQSGLDLRHFKNGEDVPKPLQAFSFSPFARPRSLLCQPYPKTFRILSFLDSGGILDGTLRRPHRPPVPLMEPPANCHTLASYMRSFTCPDYTDEWDALDYAGLGWEAVPEIHETTKGVVFPKEKKQQGARTSGFRAGSVVGVESTDWVATKALRESKAKQWQIKIFAEGDRGEIEPVAGFHVWDGASYTYRDIYVFVYLLHDPVTRNQGFTLYWRKPNGNNDGAVIPWNDRTSITEGDLNYVCAGGDSCSFRHRPPLYYDFVWGTENLANSGKTELASSSNHAMTGPLMPESTSVEGASTAKYSVKFGDVVKARDTLWPRAEPSPCLLCCHTTPQTKVAHIFRYTHAAHMYKFRNIFDPGAFAPQTYKSAALVSNRVTHKAVGLNRKLDRHPSNMMMLCQNCESSFDRLNRCVNVFTFPPQLMLVEPGRNNRKAAVEMEGALETDRFENVQAGTDRFYDALRTIFPNRALLALHMVASLMEHSLPPPPIKVDYAGIVTGNPMAEGSIPEDEGSVDDDW